MRKFQPNWYGAMREHCWTVRNIMREFRVTRAIAQHIQHAFPSYDECRAIVSAHEELTSQVGH